MQTALSTRSSSAGSMDGGTHGDRESETTTKVPDPDLNRGRCSFVPCSRCSELQMNFLEHLHCGSALNDHLCLFPSSHKTATLFNGAVWCVNACRLRMYLRWRMWESSMVRWPRRRVCCCVDRPSLEMAQTRASITESSRRSSLFLLSSSSAVWGELVHKSERDDTEDFGRGDDTNVHLENFSSRCLLTVIISMFLVY